MEQRRESRLNISKVVTLKVVSLMGDAGTGNALNARVLDVSGSGMRLEVSLPVPSGAAVEIEDGRTRVLGETVRCEPKSGGYILAVRVSKTMSIADNPDQP